jgi:ABC-type cobalamin/Fe3+-siderophores transport system ATPase subunit
MNDRQKIEAVIKKTKIQNLGARLVEELSGGE